MSRYVDIESEFLKEWMRNETKKAMQHTEALIEGKYWLYSPEGLNGLINEILGLMPEVDVVEVVRCRDCKHKPYRDEDGFVEPESGRCPCINDDDDYYSWIPEDDWFCADGKRREDGRENLHCNDT